MNFAYKIKSKKLKKKSTNTLNMLSKNDILYPSNFIVKQEVLSYNVCNRTDRKGVIKWDLLKR